jgi:hypothetical protein
VQQSVVQADPDADISVSIVWINVLEDDTSEMARQAAEEMIQDPRVHHFHDPRGLAGEAIAQSLGAEEGKVAWDVYLFYQRGHEWGAEPPTPNVWMHQLVGSSWAAPAYYRSRESLVEELHTTMKMLT